MTNSLLLPLVFAGLAGLGFALIVATRKNAWSARVFFLLALRLAIGWHFLFEGMHKFHTVTVGPGEYNRVFTSEPYFKVAPGPLGPLMRKQFSDPSAYIAEKLKRGGEMDSKGVAGLDVGAQADLCPPAVGEAFDSVEDLGVEATKTESDADLKAADATEAKAIKDATDAEQRALKGEWTDEERDRIRRQADEDRNKARAKADYRRDKARSRVTAYQELGREFIAAVKTRPGGMPVAEQIEAVVLALKSEAEGEIKAATAAEDKAIQEVTAIERRTLKGEWTEAEKATIRAKTAAETVKAHEQAQKERAAAKKKGESPKTTVLARKIAAKAAFARWVYGVEGRPAKIKGITGEVSLTAPQRQAHIDWLRAKSKEEEDRLSAGLGQGYGIDQKKAGELRADAAAAEAEFAADIDAYITELKKDLTGGKLPPASTPEPSRGQQLDKITMWFLIAVGGMLLVGLFTRLSCVLAAGFLVMTYLTHPPFPWFALPPNTEGNPVFINKNVIEALALLAIATFPTGRWLGLDALIARLCPCGRRRNAEPLPA